MKNKFFILCACIGLCMALFAGVFAVTGKADLLGTVGNGLLYPFQWAAKQVGNGVTGFAHQFADVSQMQNEIESLQAENERLRTAVRDAELKQQENSRLYGYLSMKEEHTDWSLCAATVIATVTSDGYATELTLNKGLSSGVNTGMPVVTPMGLVGIVCEVGLSYCKVRTVIATDFSAGAVLVRAAEVGMAEGDFTALKSGRCVLRYLGAEADAQEGDIVVTSGKGSVYPYGIPIGTVTGVSSNAYTRTTEAEIETYCDFAALKEVSVLISYVHTTGEAEP